MNAIEIKNVTKKFKVYYDKGRSIKEKILFQNRNRYEERWVLKGVSFDVKKGEAIGLIGQNGCGKSTLLKLMTRILYPDTGEITMHGRVSSLIELGAGFHPDMSGKENIYTNAAIFGLTRKEIDARIQMIIDFSELQEFIDNPVRTYSSGMYMRLAFAVAINVDADILLIDEILAVGDVNFQTKCFNKLQEIKKQGTTIIIVSHDMSSIERICDKAIWIHDGVIASKGKTRQVSDEYLEAMMSKEVEESSKETDFSKKQDKEIVGTESGESEGIEDSSGKPKGFRRWGSKEIVVTSVQLINAQGNQVVKFKTGEKITIEIGFHKNQEITRFCSGICINRNDGVIAYGTNTLIDQCIVSSDGFMDGTVFFEMEQANLLNGQYLLQVAFTEETGGNAYDYCCDILSFDVYTVAQDIGMIRIPHQWVHKFKPKTKD